MPDTRVYKAGEEITATLTLEPGHTVPTGVWLSLNHQLEAGTSQAAIANRITYLNLQSVSAMLGTPSAPPGGSLTITVQAKIPNHILGGMYKPTSATFFMPDGSQRQVPEPDPDGDFVRHIAGRPADGVRYACHQGSRLRIPLAIATVGAVASAWEQLDDRARA